MNCYTRPLALKGDEMGEKKNEFRFTIQFNPGDKRHLEAAKIINLQGRRKAQYLVSAILFYERNEGRADVESVKVDYHIIKDIVNQVLAEKSEKKIEKVNFDLQEDKRGNQTQKNISINSELTLDQDKHSPIIDSIAAFRRKK